MNLWWLEQLHITVEAYPPNGAAAHPAQLSARAMHSCTLRRAACCSQRVDCRNSRSASRAINAGSLRGAACRSRRVDFRNPRLIAISSGCRAEGLRSRSRASLSRDACCMLAMPMRGHFSQLRPRAVQVVWRSKGGGEHD